MIHYSNKLHSRTFDKMLLDREMNKNGAVIFIDFMHNSKLLSLELSTAMELRTNVRSATNCLSLECIEYRYLLSGSMSGNISLFDLEEFPSSGARTSLQPILQHTPSIPHNNASSSSNTGGTVSSLQWYPEDSGAFISAGMNGKVSIFDTNYFSVVGEFPFDQVIYSAKMKTNQGNALIAVALQDGTVRLCDPRTRDCSHILKGHDRQVTQVDWCPAVGCEYLLASSGMDGAVRVWDVRRAGSANAAVVRSLDWRGDFTAASKIDTRKLYTSLAHSRNASSGIQIKDATQLYRAADGGSVRAGRAHDGGVVSMRYTSCGNFIVTGGNDHRLRLWQAHTGNLIPVNYSDNILPTAQLPYDIGIAELSYASTDVLLVPASNNCAFANPSGEGEVRTSEGDILMIPMHSDGQPTRVLKGHMERVTAITCRKPQQQVISAARDGMIFLWAAPSSRRTTPACDERAEERRQQRLYFGSTGPRYDYQQVLTRVGQIGQAGQSGLASSEAVESSPSLVARRPLLLPVAIDETAQSIIDLTDSPPQAATAAHRNINNSDTRRSEVLTDGSDESGDDWSDDEAPLPLQSTSSSSFFRSPAKRARTSAAAIISAAGVASSSSDTHSNGNSAVNTITAVPSTSSSGQPGRSFVPPIIRQYMQDASRSTQPSSSSSSQTVATAPSVASATGPTAAQRDWGNIDTIFEASVASALPTAATLLEVPTRGGGSSTTGSSSGQNNAKNNSNLTADQRYSQWLKQMRGKAKKK